MNFRDLQVLIPFWNIVYMYREYKSLKQTREDCNYVRERVDKDVSNVIDLSAVRDVAKTTYNRCTERACEKELDLIARPYDHNTKAF